MTTPMLNRLWRRHPELRQRILRLYARHVFHYNGGKFWGQMEHVAWKRRRAGL